MNKKPKILLYDIETTPNLAYVWGKWQQDVIAYEEEWHILSFAYKWLGQKKVYCRSLRDYNDKPGSDKLLVKDLWKLFEKADILIAHNGDAFDQKKSNARFVFWKMRPPSPYRTIDTLKIARKYFKFNSNKLNDLAKILNIGSKVKHIGFDLWLGCMQNKAAAWKIMVKYNKHDVTLLELVYLRLRVWAEHTPSIAAFNRPDACPTCGSTRPLKSNGWRYMKTRRHRKYKCMDCGKYCTDTTADKGFKRTKK